MKNKILFIFLFFSINLNFAQSKFSSKVDSIIEPFQSQNGPGFSIGIVQNGKLVYYKGVGLANLEYNISNSDTSIYGIASIAKQFTASCIYSLIKENKISLNDDVRKYIPELPFYCDTIKIKHMLNHTSGIRNYQALMDLAGFDSDKEYYDNKTVLEIACNQKGLNNIPGEKVIYGNTAYTLLAIIIERCSKQKLNDYAKSHIFFPLDMKHTFYRVENNSIIKNKAVGYEKDEDGSYIQFPNIQCSYGAGGMGSTIQDLAKWTNVLNGTNNQFLDLTNFLTTCEILNNGDTALYARGLMIDNYKGVKTLHHSGYGIGGQSQIITVPELNLSVIILTNLESIDPSQLSYQILDLFIRAKQTKHNNTVKTYRPKSAMLQKSVGQYKELNSDMKMEIFAENDTLKSLGSLGKKPHVLIASDENKFYRATNKSVKYEFIFSKNKDADMIIYFGGNPFYFKRAIFIDPKRVNPNEFIGNYFSSELVVLYQFTVENGKLFLSYRNNDKIELLPGQKDEFGNGNRVLYSFMRNEKNEVNTVIVASEGTVKNIQFIKKE